jgi:transcriptional regulator with XRE-family HTH domain
LGQRQELPARSPGYAIGQPRIPDDDRAACSGGLQQPLVSSCDLAYAIVYSVEMADRTSVAGDLLRLARVKAGLTQGELGERAGVAQSLISAYENGRRQPTIPTLMRLLEAAGFELRMRLELPDGQALAAEQWARTRPAAERRRWKREQAAASSR